MNYSIFSLIATLLWGIDLSRIATTGSSAAGNLSVWFAVHDDLACPNSPDPILRESTRLTTIITKNAQTSNDPYFWMENIYCGDVVHTSIYDFYGVKYMDFDELKEVNLNLRSSKVELNQICHEQIVSDLFNRKNYYAINN